MNEILKRKAENLWGVRYFRPKHLELIEAPQYAFG